MLPRSGWTCERTSVARSSTAAISGRPRLARHGRRGGTVGLRRADRLEDVLHVLAGVHQIGGEHVEQVLVPGGQPQGVHGMHEAAAQEPSPQQVDEVA